MTNSENKITDVLLDITQAATSDLNALRIVKAALGRPDIKSSTVEQAVLDTWATGQLTLAQALEVRDKIAQLQAGADTYIIRAKPSRRSSIVGGTDNGYLYHHAGLDFTADLEQAQRYNSAQDAHMHLGQLRANPDRDTSLYNSCEIVKYSQALQQSKKHVQEAVQDLDFSGLFYELEIVAKNVQAVAQRADLSVSLAPAGLKPYNDHQWVLALNIFGDFESIAQATSAAKQFKRDLQARCGLAVAVDCNSEEFFSLLATIQE